MTEPVSVVERLRRHVTPDDRDDRTFIAVRVEEVRALLLAAEAGQAIVNVVDDPEGERFTRMVDITEARLRPALAVLNGEAT